MTFEQLLFELRHNVLHDRSDRVEGPSDYLWSDDTLKLYINEAYQRFARTALCIRDGSTVEATRVTLQAGEAEYPLHPSVIAVMTAKLADTPGNLQRVGNYSFGGYQRVYDPLRDVATWEYLPPGKPLAYSTDEEIAEGASSARDAVIMRVYPVPDEDFDNTEVHLRVIRMPLAPLVDPEDVPELPDSHHMEMLDWAAYLALRIADHDAGMPSRANEFRERFLENVAAARKLMMRRMFAPTGFRPGWTWERD